MSRYINKDEVLAEFDKLFFSDEMAEFRINYGTNGQRDYIINFVKNLPTAEVKPIVYGKWEIYKAYQCGIEEQWFQCSKCGWENALTIPRNYCPNCGAFMKKESEEEE